MKGFAIKLFSLVFIIIIGYFSYDFYLQLNHDESKNVVSTQKAKKLELFKNYEGEINKHPSSSLYNNTFQTPEFYDDVDWYRITNDKERQQLWSSEKRCCENKWKVNKNFKIYHKACHNGILEFPEDKEMVTKCLWTMGFSETKDINPKLLTFLINNYFDHNSRIDNCYNCKKADTVTRATISLSRYTSNDNFMDGIKRLELVYDKRNKDISYWIQLELFEQLVSLYKKAHQAGENIIDVTRKDRFNKAIIMIEEFTEKESKKKTIQRLKEQFSKF